MSSEVLYIPELAAMLGKTEAAVRAAVQRGSDAVPPPFRLGRLHAWRKADVDAWLAAKAGAATVDSEGGEA